MNEKRSLVIPKIDLVKIIDKKYFYSLKRDFLSNDSVFENQELYDDFMRDPKPNLKPDTITIHKYDYEVSEEVEGVDENGVFGISGGDVISKELKENEDIEYNFFTDYLILGIEKGRKSYLIDINKSLVNADKFKEHILIGFFTEKKIEIRTALDKTTKVKEFIKKDFNINLISCLNSILDKINSLEKIHLPSKKINLSLNKAEALLLFHALYEKDVFTEATNKADLGRFIDQHVTYRKLNIDKVVKKAYDSTFGLISPKKEGVKGQPISLELLQRLEKIEDGLFDFLKK